MCLITSPEIFLTYISIILEMPHRNNSIYPIVARQEDKKVSAIVGLIIGISLSKTLIQTAQLAHSKKCLVSYFFLPMMMLYNSLHFAVFLGEIFHCWHWNLLSDNFQCGWWWVFCRNDGFSFLLFPFGVHVQFMERFYACVYIKTISLHKVIYTKLFICYKAEVYSKEQNLHHCFLCSFFSLTPFHITLYNRYWGTYAMASSPFCHVWMSDADVLYSISQEICTRFCCALLCCGYAIVHNEFTWCIYPYSSGLLCWHWGNR